MNKELNGLEFVGGTALIIIACSLFVGLIMLVEDYCRMRRDVKRIRRELETVDENVTYIEGRVFRLEAKRTNKAK